MRDVLIENSDGGVVYTLVFIYALGKWVGFNKLEDKYFSGKTEVELRDTIAESYILKEIIKSLN